MSKLQQAKFGTVFETQRR